MAKAKNMQNHDSTFLLTANKKILQNLRVKLVCMSIRKIMNYTKDKVPLGTPTVSVTFIQMTKLSEWRTTSCTVPSLRIQRYMTICT
jgi:hypothetical protein